MKLLFLLALLATGYTSAYAQTQKGQKITSGSLGLAYAGYKATSSVGATERGVQGHTFGFSVTLNRGVFFKDNWSIKYSLSPSFSRGNNNDAVGRPLTYENVVTGSGIGAGLALRRYWPLADRLHVYVGGGLQGEVALITNTLTVPVSVVGNRKTESTSWSVQPVGQAGLLYTLTNRLALEANAQSSGFPVNVSGVSFGLALLTGNSGGETYLAREAIDAPQMQKGRWLVGASAVINGSGQSQQSSPQSEVSVRSSRATASVLAGKFLRENLLLGVEASYTANRATNSQLNASNRGYSVEFDAYLRSYAGRNRLRPFVQGGVFYGFSGSAGNESEDREAGLKASAGLAYLVSERFIIQSTLASVGAAYGWVSNQASGSSNSSVRIDATATLRPGFAVYYAL